MTAPTPLAALLKRLRSERGQSLRTAASGIGIDAAHLSRIERGEKGASADLCRRIARYYDVDSDLVALSSGRAPDDIVAILRANPDLLSRMRAEYVEATHR